MGQHEVTPRYGSKIQTRNPILILVRVAFVGLQCTIPRLTLHLETDQAHHTNQIYNLLELSRCYHRPELVAQLIALLMIPRGVLPLSGYGSMRVRRRSGSQVGDLHLYITLRAHHKDTRENLHRLKPVINTRIFSQAS